MKEKEKRFSLKYILLIIITIVIIVISSLLFIYYHKLMNKENFLNNIQEFAQLGDFLGGTLNPIFAFITILLLLFTIYIQTEELKATREELEKSRIAQQEQSESLKLQNQATKLQMFENTFFRLFEQHNEMLDECYDSKRNISILNYCSERSDNFAQRLEDVNKNELIDNFRCTNEHDNNIKNYFMILYQLLKFIDIQCTKNNFDAKLYTNMIRALLNDEILKALAVNCIAYSFSEYKKYIEKYELFEHLYINEKETKFNALFEVLIEYKKEAFGQNENIINKYNELKEKKPQALT